MRLLLTLITIAVAQPVFATTIRVPQDHKTIQAASDASQPDDTILVAAGKYTERIRLQPDIILRSVGNDSHGTDGRKRAEATLLDGGGKKEKQPGVVIEDDELLGKGMLRHISRFYQQVGLRVLAGHDVAPGEQQDGGKCPSGFHADLVTVQNVSHSTAVEARLESGPESGR